MNYAEIAKQYLGQKEVVFITSDGLAFFEFHFAKSHADSKGLELMTFEKSKMVEEKKDVPQEVAKPVKSKKNANK